MSRGLSDLQEWILRRAARQERLYHHEILSGYFGWWPARENHGPGGYRFSPDFIGRQRYCAVHAALSRSCLRLADRGLVTCRRQVTHRWSAVEIAEAGRRWVDLHPPPRPS